MQGSPPIHLVIFALLFAALAVPLSRLTFARPSVVAPSALPHGDLATTPALLRLRFAHVPTKASVKLGDRELLPQAPVATANVECPAALELGPDGVEFLVSATWPEGTPDTALTLEVEPDGLDAQAQTRWSAGANLTEVYPFHWKP
ncbi:MAG: hypothetical protein ACOYMN_08835 [Roseimicrobium sp.]